MSASDAVVLVSPRKAEVPGTVERELVPAARRAAVAVPVLLVGLVLGVVLVVLPPHGLFSLAAFVVSGVVAWAQWSRSEIVREVAFTCTCGAEARVTDVGPWSADLWVRCPGCDTPWQVPPRKA